MNRIETHNEFPVRVATPFGLWRKVNNSINIFRSVYAAFLPHSPITELQSSLFLENPVHLLTAQVFPMKTLMHKLDHSENT